MADEEIFQEFQDFIAQRRKSTITLNGKQIKAYDIREITLEQFRMLIACGNDSHNNQIRVTKSGLILRECYYHCSDGRETRNGARGAICGRRSRR